MIERVAVIGAGVMGHGIAELYALAGLEVRLCDASPARLSVAMRAVAESVELLAGEGLVDEGAARSALSRIRPVEALDEALDGAELVTESIPEVFAEKVALLALIEARIAPDALVASNTSTFPITRLAAGARLPGRMVITHFFNPAQLVPLVEVVAHPAAGPEVVAATVALMRRIGKTPVVLRKEVPGFVANRLQAAIAREAFALVEEGVVEARDLDAVVTEGLGFRWAFVGPVETADLGGLDTWERVLDNLAPDLCRSTSAPALVADRVRRGELGAKSGRGIYDYGDGALHARLVERDRSLARLARLKRGLPGGRVA